MQIFCISEGHISLCFSRVTHIQYYSMITLECSWMPIVQWHEVKTKNTLGNKLLLFCGFVCDCILFLAILRQPHLAV